ncbi:MAG TPA: RNA polymerase sigma factor [Euzebyales bacterium]|nr:RNA polymerase sigma factor [Euzebyales bacterium]
MDDEATFRELFATTYEDLLRFVERRVHPLAAEDVVADVFLVAWRRLDDVPVVPDEARAWLFGVAQRTMANQRRGDARRLSLHVRVGQAHAQVKDDHSADVEARVDLARAWSKLSQPDQEALTLVGLDGLTGRQAASVLGISATAFSLRLLRARRRLPAHMSHAPGSPAVQVRLTPAGDTYAVSTPPPSHQEPS